MTTPIDMSALNFNLSSNPSPHQRYELLLQRAGLMPRVMPESGGITPGGVSQAVFSGPLGDQVNELNEVMRQYGLRFELSEFDSRVITQVVDRETGEVIRQIPAEEMLKIAEAFASDQGGQLVDASV